MKRVVQMNAEQQVELPSFLLRCGATETAGDLRSALYAGGRCEFRGDPWLYRWYTLDRKQYAAEVVA